MIAGGPINERIEKHNVTVESVAGWAVACVGTKRASYWTGAEWSIDERKAKVFDVKGEASALLSRDILFSYLRLVIIGRDPCVYLSFPTVFGT